ncbi:MAG: threonylcarbamoyl-AMP synthase, partial [Euzebyales bacterium]|nr:threonylcarbamoyl-AMP synthase [Euzebyales bacterium]
QLGDAVALYVDGGELAAQPSTIVDCSRGGADVLRGGAVSDAAVTAVSSGQVGWGQRPPEEPASEEPAPEEPASEEPAPEGPRSRAAPAEDPAPAPAPAEDPAPARPDTGES